MNKLISRNPIQRFKQGRKLIKAQFGWQVRKDGVVVNRFGVPVRANNAGYRPYSMTQDASYQTAWPNDRQIASGLYVESGTNNVYASRPEDDGSAVGNLISTGPEAPANGTYYESTDATGKVVDRGRYFGGKKHSLPIGGSSSNKKSRTVKKVSTPRNPGAYHNIVTWQNKLKDFYEPGTFAADGKWGDNTEAAYQKYLQLVNVPEMSQEEAKAATTPRQVQFANPVNLNSTPIQVPQTYNRTQVREFLRNKGVNPYDFSGDQRRAIRMILNGQGTDQDKALVQSMGIFKKGGQLPSRNPITRFRNRKSN